MSDFNVHDYTDIINLPHHISKKHRPMPITDRAAQFGAFSALSGHSDQIEETARQTTDELFLDEYLIELINARLNELNDIIDTKPEIRVTYYVPDKEKNGGEYVTYRGSLRRIDEVLKKLHFEDGTVINIKDIYTID